MNSLAFRSIGLRAGAAMPPTEIRHWASVVALGVGWVATASASTATAQGADQFPGYDATRQELLAEGWLVASI